jgi:hypothetical protein
MTTLIEFRNALTVAGWAIRHQSKKDGRITSAYLYRRDDGLGEEREIRIADHALGSTAFGEKQGGRWAVDIIVDPELSLDDHLRAIDDEDYRSSGGGFDEGYSVAEFMES